MRTANVIKARDGEDIATEKENKNMEELISRIVSTSLPSAAPVSGYSQWDVDQALRRYIRALRLNYLRKLRRAKRNHQFIVLQIQN